jgi:hypothetical protein
METLLSGQDIYDIIGEEIPIVTSSSIQKASSLLDIFGDNNKALVLYDSQSNGKNVIGHWCALLYNKDGLSFYDPYGDFIDDQLDFLPPDYRIKTNQIKGGLSKLIYYSPFTKIHYNPHKHQNVKGSATCGRHCALFLKFGEEPEKYNDFIKSIAKDIGTSTDEASYLITKRMIGK